MPRNARFTSALRGRGNALAVAGAAAALIGAGAGVAAAAAPAAAAPTHSAHARALNAAGAKDRASLAHAPAVSHSAVSHAAVSHAAVSHAAAAAGAAHVAHPAPVVHATAARHAQAPARHSAPARPYEIYDSVTPSAIPAGHEIATYADGGYAASPSQVHGKNVLWIDTNGSDPKANALDVEPGDATPSGAAAWAKAKLTAQPGATAIIYTMRSDWAAAKAAVDALPGSMSSHVKWWIADPTGTPHVVPGASATQWYWGPNYDITTATPGF